MKRTCIFLVLLLSTVTVDAASPAFNLHARRMGPYTMWHRGYHDPAWGVPYSVVVPRRADLQTTWSWGVGGTSVEPIYNQYIRRPGGIDSVPTIPTPPWPSSTDQFGGYYTRMSRRP